MFEKCTDMQKWRSDEVLHYREYLKTLREDSREYMIFKKSIEDLERIRL